MNAIERLTQFFQPPPAEVKAARQLAESKRYLLDAYAYREEAEAAVKKYEERIKRLTTPVRGTAK